MFRLPDHRARRAACRTTRGLVAVLLIGSACASPPEDPAAPVPEEVLRGTDRSLSWVVHSEEERIVDVRLGPVALPAGGGALRTPIQVVEIPVDGWLHGFDWSIVDRNGRDLPSVLLHHVNLIDPDRRELFSTTARRVLAAGRETQEQSLPALVGYPVSRGTRLLVVAMFDNPTGTDIPEAFLRIRLPYSRPGGVDPLSVYPFYMDVMGPVGEKSFAVPPGTTTQSWEGSPAIDVRILGLGGHLHDHAVALRLEDVTTGAVLWRAQPELDGNGRLKAIPVQMVWWRGGIPLKRDHTYRLTAEYRNATDAPTAHGGMGVLAGIALGRESDWPRLDPGDTDYRADLRNVISAPASGGHAHGHMH